MTIAEAVQLILQSSFDEVVDGLHDLFPALHRGGGRVPPRDSYVASSTRGLFDLRPTAPACSFRIRAPGRG